MKKNDFVHKLVLCISIVLCRLFVDYSYFNDISINYGYYGFEDHRTTASLILSWAVLFFFIFLILKTIKKDLRLSNIIILVIAVLSIPSLTTLIYANFLNDEFVLLGVVYWFILIAAYLLSYKKVIKKIGFKFDKYKLDDRVALLIGFFSILLVLFISWRYTGFRIDFSLDNVYDLRMEARTYEIPLILKYLFEWSRSINIVLLAYFLYKRKYFISSLFFVAQLLSFGVDGLKSTLFMTFLTVFLSIFFNKKKQKDASSLIIFGVTGVTFAGVIEKIILKTSNIIEIIVRRLMILPVYLNSCYVDFFSSHQPDFFRRSIFKYFGFTSSYADLEFLIGQIYFNRPLMRCNNGLIAEAVTNFGFIGIVIGPILFVIILRLMDRCVFGLNNKVIIIVGVYFGIRLTDTFLSVGLFTHGFLIAILLMMMMRDSTGDIISDDRIATINWRDKG